MVGKLSVKGQLAEFDLQHMGAGGMHPIFKDDLKSRSDSGYSNTISFRFLRGMLKGITIMP
jgi:hypothetical protein